MFASTEVITKKALNETEAYLEDPREAGAEHTRSEDSGYTFLPAPARHPSSPIKGSSSLFPAKRATCVGFNF